MTSVHSNIDTYHNQGFAVFRKVLDTSKLFIVKDHLDKLLTNATFPENIAYHERPGDKIWFDIISDSRLLDIAEQFVGPDLALFASAYVCKPPHQGKPVLWHQDGSYWPIEPLDVISLWLAVDDSNPENGCMRVLPGSHRRALSELVVRSDLPNALGSSMRGEQEIDDRSAVDVILESGDVSVHHPNLIHGSNPNCSTQRRAGLTIRYIASSARILLEGAFADQAVNGRWPTAFHLRGARGIDQYNTPPISPVQNLL